MNFSLLPSSLEKEVEKKSTLNSQYLWYKRMLARWVCKLTKEAAILWNVQTNPQEERLTQWLTIGILCGNSKAVYSMSFSPTTAGENLQQTKTCSVRQGLLFFFFFAFSSSSFLSFFFSSFLFLSPFSPRVDWGRSKRSKHAEKHHPLSSLLGQSSNLFVKNKRKCKSSLNEIYRQQLGLGLEVAEGFSVSISLASVRCVSGSFFLSNVLFLLVWRVGLGSCTASHHEDPKAVGNRRRVRECSFAAFSKMKRCCPWNVACFGCIGWRSES